MIKQCSHCHKDKDLSEFSSDKSCPSGKSSWCKQCQADNYKLNRTKRVEASRRWYFAHKDKVCEKSRARHKAKYPFEKDHQLDKRFGAGAAEYRKKQLILQQGRCAICGRKETDCTKALALDHNHLTGQWRGLLCDLCNTAIGKLHDDPAMIQRAVDYLLSYDEVPV